ncbi:MAG: hypothetical protein JSV17_15040 [Candidatus Aminicenantes bacterium]|nr:MAG: hypothetical protein JSV17_15040 [Candidatus Aminicenantes bacterium]
MAKTDSMSPKMCEKIYEKTGEVKIYGRGSLGGKGIGLAKINESPIPHAHRLRTRILTTTYFDSFVDNGQKLDKNKFNILISILEELGNIPISVRSSATDEGGISPKGVGPIHAGENTSFMLPNNHSDFSVRLEQLEQAICHIYADFILKQPSESKEKMAIVINPIPGIHDDTLAGPFYYPYISGVANSYFPYALKTQNPDDGFARIAFGHGYATVLDDFPVISMVTIKEPIPQRFLSTGQGQQYFYALDMTKNNGLQGNELETMKTLHVRFANHEKVKLLGTHNNMITIKELVQNNHFGFKTGLIKIMEMISKRVTSHFQIEFVFNIDFKQKEEEAGRFHVVQLTYLPTLRFETIKIPESIGHTYLSISSLQGHGIKKGIKYALVISPFIYTQNMHDEVVRNIADFNAKMREQNETYMMIVPGRLGSTNRNWGIQVDYRIVDRAVAIFEYGVDIAGRSEPLPEDSSLSGGLYGSHFLYMIQGGFNEEQKRLETRMYGTQGTHFLTNLISNNVIYGYIAPAQDLIDPWLFSGSRHSDPFFVREFPKKVKIYADSKNQRCMVSD